MSGFVSWVMSILAVIVVGTVLDIFLSEKKLGKLVRSVFASLLVLVIISPLPSLINGCDSHNGSIFQGEIVLDEKYLTYVNKQKTEALENGLEAALKDDGYAGIVAEITADFSAEIIISRVQLNLSKLVIENPSLNINKIESICAFAAGHLGIDKSVIIVVGA